MTDPPKTSVGGGFKMSLGGKKKHAVRVTSKRATLDDGPHHQREEESKVKQELIMGFDETGVQTVEKKVEKETFIIPSLPNKNWKVEAERRRSEAQSGKRYKPESVDTAQTFVKGDETTGKSASKNTPAGYGLQLPLAETKRRRIDQANAIRDALEAKQYRQDSHELQETATQHAYDSMPVEEFGAAMLRGMGWKEGQAIGRLHKQTKLAEFNPSPRPMLLGLGAKPFGDGKPENEKSSDSKTRDDAK